VLLALRLAERTSRRDLALLGLALGCGWWASPQILILAVPALVWLVARRPAVVRGWWLVVPAAVLGAAPWLVANLRHDWLSLHVIADAGGPGSRLHNLVVATLPTALGLRVPFSLHWVGSVWLGLVLYAIALVAVLAPGRGRVRPLLLTLAVFPFLYAVSPYASLNREPRYLDLLLPILALLLARWATRPTAAVAIVAVAAALSIAGLVAIERGNLSAPVVEGRPLPADIAPLLRTLQEKHVTRVWANYWIAWRIDFESGEHIVAASTGTGGVHYERAGSRVVPVVESGRYPPYVEADRRAADAAFVFVATPPPPRLAGYRSIAAGAYVVELPRRASATSSKP
jgi:hypothetical protein